MTRDDAAEIKRLLNQNLEGIVSKFWPGHVARARIAYCAPSGRKDDLGSFVVYLGSVGKYHRGEWQRSSRGIGGDELNLFAYGDSGERSHKATAETFRAARQYLNLDTSRPESEEDRQRRADDQARFEQKRVDDERRAQERDRARVMTAGDLWMESAPIGGTQAEAYLAARGIPMPPEGWGDSLRFNGRVLYDLDHALSFPTLVCRVDDVGGDLTAVWKIHMHPSKPAKAPVDKAKIGAGVAAGGAVRLGGTSDHIGLGEGVETCLAARALVKYRFPVWAGLSTAGVAGFEPPIGVERITSFPDGDKPWRRDGDLIVIAEPAGRAAVRKLRERMTAIDMRHDSQPEPKMFRDYLDIWQSRLRVEVQA